MRFTSANSREFAVKSRESRRIAKIARDQLLANAIVIAAKIPEHPTYLTERLARVRLQLDRIDEMMLTENDPSKLDRLASAQMRLAEQERLLCDRPLPGSRKPLAEKASKDIGPGAWIAEPVPIPVAPTQPTPPASPCCPCVPPTPSEPLQVVVQTPPENTST